MNLPAWGVNIVKSLKAISRRRMEDEHSTLNNEHDYDDETNYEHDPNKMMSIKRRRLNPLITGWNFIKSCLTDMSKCANDLLVLASDASVGLPQWGINIVKSLKAIAGRRRLETKSFEEVMMKKTTHSNHVAERRRLNPLVTGWNFIKDCLTDMSSCASDILILAEKVSMGLPGWALNVVKALKAVITGRSDKGRRLNR